MQSKADGASGVDSVVRTLPLQKQHRLRLYGSALWIVDQAQGPERPQVIEVPARGPADADLVREHIPGHVLRIDRDERPQERRLGRADPMG